MWSQELFLLSRAWWDALHETETMTCLCRNASCWGRTNNAHSLLCQKKKKKKKRSKGEKKNAWMNEKKMKEKKERMIFIIGSAEALPILCVSDFVSSRERERDACDVIDITLKSRVIMHVITSTARWPNAYAYASTRSEPAAAVECSKCMTSQTTNSNSCDRAVAQVKYRSTYPNNPGEWTASTEEISKKGIKLILKTIGNRKGDCAWSCSRWQTQPEKICKLLSTNQ